MTPIQTTHNMTTADKVRQIKQTFRLYMNGVTADSLRQKGLNYKISWGVSLQHLQEIATEYGQQQDLAEQLWTSNVRECKLLAIMTYPIQDFDEHTAQRWLQDITNQELAEMLTFHILQHLPYAKTLALQLLASHNDMHLLCAYNILSRLFLKSVTLTSDEATFFTQKAKHTLISGSYALKHAASNCLLRYTT